MNFDHFRSASWLNVENNQGYGLCEIPLPRDRQISDLLQDWVKMEDLSRNAALLGVLPEYRFTLLAYSERMASLAVRDHNKQHIFLGLLALGLDGWHDDWRDNAIIISLHHDAIKRVGLLPACIFEEAAELLPQRPGDALRSFLGRSDHDKSLEAMGYIPGADIDGFRYKRAW